MKSKVVGSCGRCEGNNIPISEWRMANGEWRVENGEWRMENGEWRMENGEWRMENGEWRMENGEWRMVVNKGGNLKSGDHSPFSILHSLCLKLGLSFIVRV